MIGEFFNTFNISILLYVKRDYLSAELKWCALIFIGKTVSLNNDLINLFIKVCS